MNAGQSLLQRAVGTARARALCLGWDDAASKRGPSVHQQFLVRGDTLLSSHRSVAALVQPASGGMARGGFHRAATGDRAVSTRSSSPEQCSGRVSCRCGHRHARQDRASSWGPGTLLRGERGPAPLRQSTAAKAAAGHPASGAAPSNTRRGKTRVMARMFAAVAGSCSPR